jgi:hypothetical protein
MPSTHMADCIYINRLTVFQAPPSYLVSSDLLGQGSVNLSIQLSAGGLGLPPCACCMQG